MSHVTLPMFGDQSARFVGAKLNVRANTIELHFDVEGTGIIPVSLDKTDATIIHEKLGKGIGQLK